MKTKICNKCKTEKDVSLFNKRYDSASGIRSICKECVLNYSKSKRKLKIKLEEEVKISKVCSKCKLDKPFSQYGKNKSSKYGITSSCKECENEYKRNNIEKIRLRDKLRYYKNIEKRKSLAAIKRDKERSNPDKVLQVRKYLKNYYQDNKEAVQKQGKQYRVLHAEKRRMYAAEYYKNNKQEILEKQRVYSSARKAINVKNSYTWRENNRERYVLGRRKRAKERYFTDICYRLKSNIVSRMNLALSKRTKSGRTEELLGCSIEQFRIYLESKFANGMNWENRFEWHIDHIKPCCSFDLSDPEQQKQCFHYTNLQPLWATTAIAIANGEDENYIGNIEKGGKKNE